MAAGRQTVLLRAFAHAERINALSGVLVDGDGVAQPTIWLTPTGWPVPLPSAHEASPSR